MFPFKVHIIESPSPTDFLEGRQEGDALYRILKLGGIAVTEPQTVITGDVFRKVIGDLTAHFTKAGMVPPLPILHISAHGDENGIAFSAPNEILKWEDLGNILQPLSAAIGGNLLVCMSSCYGHSGYKMARRITTHPFHTLIGPTADIVWSDTLIAYSTFYHQLFSKSIDIPNAVTSMHTASGLPAGTFQVIHGEDVRKGFLEAINKYIKDHILSPAPK